MSIPLNLKLKDGVEPSILLKYGFVPKYDECTGVIKKYVKRIPIDPNYHNNRHFSFVLYTEHTRRGIFRKRFFYEAWMSGFNWGSLCDKEALQLLYDLIKDGIVEPAEELKGGAE